MLHCASAIVVTLQDVDAESSLLRFYRKAKFAFVVSGKSSRSEWHFGKVTKGWVRFC